MAIQVVELRNITKRFPGVLANDGVNLQVRAGEIHALLGENGAGKSTLMKVLYGMYRPTEGEIFINGERVELRSPADALAQGIGMIHQHFQLVPGFTVAENVALGLKSSRGPLTDLDVVSKRMRDLAGQYGLRVEPNALVWQLAVGQQQRVEIIKALYRDASLLILDEPTAVLTPQEVNELFDILRRLRDAGNGLIFITHKLDQVMEVSDHVTVLRDGRVAGRVETKQTNQKELAHMMVGREVVTHWNKQEATTPDAVLQVQDLAVDNDKGLAAVNQASFDVCAGEILGIAGVSGNGQRELTEAIAGMRRVRGGAIRLENRDVTNHTPAQMIAAGVAFIPEERMVMGVIREFSVAENAILETYAQPPLAKRGFFDFTQINTHCTKLVREYDVKTPSLDTPVKSLSGGNIQKLIMARELDRNPRLLIAAQPTRGVDIGATEYIHKRLIQQRANGTAILLISEDLEEVRALSDRVAVMYEGRIVAIVPPDTSVQELGLMMAGSPRV